MPRTRVYTTKTINTSPLNPATKINENVSMLPAMFPVAVPTANHAFSYKKGWLSSINDRPENYDPIQAIQKSYTKSKIAYRIQSFLLKDVVSEGLLHFLAICKSNDCSLWPTNYVPL